MNRVISMLFAVTLPLWLCISAHFLALEAGHDCHDDKDCPVCTCIQICTNMQKNMSNALLAVALVIVFATVNTYIPFLSEYLRTADTPVTKKIRLNN